MKTSELNDAWYMEVITSLPRQHLDVLIQEADKEGLDLISMAVVAVRQKMLREGLSSPEDLI